MYQDTTSLAPPPEYAPRSALELLFHYPDLHVIDVRVDEDANAIPATLPRANRHSHMTQLPGRTPCLVVCHKGLKLSRGTAAMIRAQGGTAMVVAGGILAWRDAGLPMIDVAEPSPRAFTATGPDRCLAAWASARFLPGAPPVLQVGSDDANAVADLFEAPLLMRDSLCTALGLAWPGYEGFLARCDALADLLSKATTSQAFAIFDATFMASLPRESKDV